MNNNVFLYVRSRFLEQTLFRLSIFLLILSFSVIVEAQIERGDALEFDGVDDYVNLTSSADFDFNGTDNFTLETWFKTTSNSNTRIISKFNSGSDGYQISYNAGDVSFFVRTSSGNTSVSSSIGTLNDGTWHHIAAVFMAGNMELFVDGVSQGTAISTGDPSNSAAIFAGCFGGSVLFFEGSIDEVRIWNVARTAQEIRENMHLTLDGGETGLVSYYPFNNGSGTTLTDVASGNDGTLINMDAATDWITSEVNVGNDLANNSNSVSHANVGTGIFDFAAANLSIDFTAHSTTEDITVTYQEFDPNATTGASGTNIIQNPMWTVNKSTSSSTQSMDMTFTTSALTSTNSCELRLYNRAMGVDGAWNLLGTASSATANTATFKGVNNTGQFMLVEAPAGLTDITRGTALEFDGTDDYVDLGDVNAFDFGVSDYTISFWLRTGQSAVNRVGLLSKRSACGTDNFWDLRIEPTGGLRWENCETGGGLNFSATLSPTPVNDGQWHHIAITRTSGTMSIYLDGILDVSQAVPTANISNAASVLLGREAVCFSDNLDGAMDEVRIWNVARTATEIRENMHLTLAGCETGLIAYYQFNDGTSSSTLADITGGNDGTLINMDAATDWITSGVNVGDDALGNSVSETQTIAANAAIANTYNFATANLEIEIINHSISEDFTVTYQEYTPNTLSGANAMEYYDNPVWTINKETNTSRHKLNLIFTNTNAPFTANKTKYRLYWRAMNSDANWTSISADADIISASQIRFSGMYETGQFMIVKTSDADVTDVRGNMYEFDGTNDHIRLGTALIPTTGAFTLSAWIKTTDNSAGIITQYSGSSNPARFGVRIVGGRIRYWRASNVATTTATVNDGQWHHIAVTKDNTNAVNLYIDGVLSATGTDAVGIQNATTCLANFGTTTNVPYEGAMDEVSIWNVARTEDEIRSTMHLTLKGNETGLISYYQFNTDDAVGIGGGVKDALGVNDGTARNMDAEDYIPSEVAVAAGVSQMIDVTVAGIADFYEPEVSINFGASHPSGNVWVYRLETEKPHGWNETAGNFDFDNEYFVVQNFGSNQTFDVLSDMTFGRLNYIDPTVTPSDIEVYKRESNAYGDWTGHSLGGANAIQGGSSGTCAYNTSNGINSFSQFVLVNKSGATSNTELPIELAAFEAERRDVETVRLDWSTAIEKDNLGFEIERMLDNETEFEVVGFVEGYGNSTQQINYALVDNNAHAGISYYRLKQMDYEGAYTYSEVRAVAGLSVHNNAQITIYPNPTESGINIHFAKVSPRAKSANVQILDQYGRLMYDATVAVDQHQVLEIEETAHLATGVYMIYILMDDNTAYTQQIIRK